MAGWIPEPEQWSFAVDLARVDELLGPNADVEEFLVRWRTWLLTPQGRFEVFYAKRTRP